MNQFQINREREKLKSLHYWLTFGSLSGALVFSVVLIRMNIVLPALCLVALGFSVYILRSLFELGKKGWVTAYAILIGIPFLLCIIPDESGIAVSALWFIPLAIFYFYCWILRYSVTEWLSDLGDEKAFDLDETHGKQVEGFLDQFR